MGPSATSLGCGVGFNFRQSFTPTPSAMAAIEIGLRAGGLFPAAGINSSVRIRSGSVNGPVIGATSTLITAPFKAGTRRDVRFAFSRPIPTPPNGVPYFIEWDCVVATELSWFVTGDLYSGGGAFNSTGVPIAGKDFVFRTLIVGSKTN